MIPELPRHSRPAARVRPACPGDQDSSKQPGDGQYKLDLVEVLTEHIKSVGRSDAREEHVEPIRKHEQGRPQEGRRRDDLLNIGDLALTAKDSLNKDIFVIGPEFYSYDEASKSHDTPLYFGTIGSANSDKLTASGSIRIFPSPEYAAHLARVENLISEGGEEKFFYESEDRKFVSKPTLADYIQDNRGLWMR
ncbi:hypothetical protein CVT25_005319 [Psilocybe cyanescens]|uniref:Uncharacterized protein n=1 Tax=Psilocybe cyanescens TaxID=93625 RepID=A0A409VPQ7_PSICY|nr:hypothetical protein CVT25_005319 [Psilocybe cyanescens]